MNYDRYVYPGTNILVNKFGIMDSAKLDMAERNSTSANILLLSREGVTGRFDRPHLQDIHKRIFGDLYDWAGEFRDIRIWKGGTEFAAPEEIPDRIDALCARIRDAGYFQGMGRAGTADALADILADLNKIHPFREGNGRTQLINLKKEVSTMANSISRNVEIKFLCDNTYLIGRVPVQIVRDAIDMSTRSGIEDAVELAMNIGRGPRGLPYGELTGMAVFPKIPGPNGMKYVRELHRFTDFPEPVREALRKEFPEYAEQI